MGTGLDNEDGRVEREPAGSRDGCRYACGLCCSGAVALGPVDNSGVGVHTRKQRRVLRMRLGLNNVKQSAERLRDGDVERSGSS